MRSWLATCSICIQRAVFLARRCHLPFPVLMVPGMPACNAQLTYYLRGLHAMGYVLSKKALLLLAADLASYPLHTLAAKVGGERGGRV